MRHALAIALSSSQRSDLQSLARSRTIPVRLAQRARIVLRAADGHQNQTIAAELRTTPKAVARWRGRFLAGGVEALRRDAPGRGRPRRITAVQVAEVVRKTTQETPAGATHWSTRTMAAAAGVSATTVRRIWASHGLKPHQVRSFKLSRDPQFEAKLTDVVGLYLNPPEHALVISVDEKSQIQALDRTQPSLPLTKGRAGTMTHDYKRHGTTTLFAAMVMADGAVIAECMPRHRHQEWLAFLKQIDAQTPPELDLHLICDNYSTHKHPKVRRWLARHPRFHVHFTPTSASWCNMVERYFRDITVQCIRRGVFRSVAELEAAIHAHITEHNRHPKPFIWTAKATDILEKVRQAQAILTGRK